MPFQVKFEESVSDEAGGSFPLLPVAIAVILILMLAGAAAVMFR
jgi:hypothetical protein